MSKSKFVVRINALPELPNKSHGHWSVMEKKRKMWHKWVYVAFASVKPKQPLNKCSIVLIRATANKCDYDNLVYSFKPVVDGLVNAGIIMDDDYDTIISRQYLLRKVPRKEAHIVISVEEL